MKAKILSVDGNDSVVKFTFDDASTSTQTIANVPVDDPEATEAFLRDYAQNYLAGKDIEAVASPAPGVVGNDIIL